MFSLQGRTYLYRLGICFVYPTRNNSWCSDANPSNHCLTLDTASTLRPNHFQHTLQYAPPHPQPHPQALQHTSPKLLQHSLQHHPCCFPLDQHRHARLAPREYCYRHLPRPYQRPVKKRPLTDVN